MSIARILPTVVGNSNAPALDYVDLVRAGVHVPEFIETGLDGDWSFDLPDETSFRSRVNTAVLDTTGRDYSLQDNVAGKYLQLFTGAPNGLPGPTADAREMTYGGIFNWRESENEATQVLMHSTTEVGGDGGEIVQFSSTHNVTLLVRSYASNITISSAALDGAGIDWAATHTFVFVAATCRITDGDETEHTLFVGGPDPLVATGSGVKTLASGGRTIAVGNAYRDEAEFHAMPTRCGRFFSASRSSTVPELNAIYQRAKVVAARRGMTVE